MTSAAFPVFFHNRVFFPPQERIDLFLQILCTPLTALSPSFSLAETHARALLTRSYFCSRYGSTLFLFY